MSEGSEDPLRNLSEILAGLPIQQQPRIKEFTAESAAKARGQASDWLSDFNAHGPLEIESIRTMAYRGRFVAVVAYRNQN